MFQKYTVTDRLNDFKNMQTFNLTNEKLECFVLAEGIWTVHFHWKMEIKEEGEKKKRGGGVLACVSALPLSC